MRRASQPCVPFFLGLLLFRPPSLSLSVCPSVCPQPRVCHGLTNRLTTRAGQSAAGKASVASRSGTRLAAPPAPPISKQNSGRALAGVGRWMAGSAGASRKGKGKINKGRKYGLRSRGRCLGGRLAPCNVPRTLRPSIIGSGRPCFLPLAAGCTSLARLCRCPYRVRLLGAAVAGAGRYPLPGGRCRSNVPRAGAAEQTWPGGPPQPETAALRTCLDGAVAVFISETARKRERELTQSQSIATSRHSLFSPSLAPPGRHSLALLPPSPSSSATLNCGDCTRTRSLAHSHPALSCSVCRTYNT